MATVPYQFKSSDTVGHGDTFLISLANPHPDIESELATIIGNNHGARLTFGRGLWEGIGEDDVTLPRQATVAVLSMVLYCLAKWYPTEEYLHVERHSVDTSYVELSRLR